MPLSNSREVKKIPFIKIETCQTFWQFFDFSGCDSCYEDVFQAAVTCVQSFEVIPCITKELQNNQCEPCICTLLPDIAAALGQSWSC